MIIFTLEIILRVYIYDVISTLGYYLSFLFKIIEHFKNFVHHDMLRAVFDDDDDDDDDAIFCFDDNIMV